MFWKKNKTEKKLGEMHSMLLHSFSNIKGDTKKIFQWLDYLYRKSQEQEQIVKHLNDELSTIPRRPEDIKRIVDSYYSYENILAKISILNSRVDELIARHQAQDLTTAQQAVQQQLPRQSFMQIEPHIVEIKKRLEKLEHKKISLKEKLMKRLTKNSKDYVKSIILSYIKKYESISATQLKEMVVDEQALCSKSSFYRLLEEIEALGDIGVIKKGKERQYFYKLKNF